MQLHKYGIVAIINLLAIIIATSCANTKNTTYFQDIADSIYRQPQSVALSIYSDPQIKPNDILQISVQTIDPQSAVMTGTQNTSSFSVQGSSSANPGASVQGFLVDRNGNVELPLVGKIKVSGLTTEGARETIRQKATVYYKDPIVNVRFVNFNVSLLGEVTRPAQYIIPNEKATILDAIAMAGDLTIYGRRENVMLIREENGEKKVVRFNLNSSNIFQNPYFYLKQGDVVYVEPTKAKASANNANTVRNLSIATSIVSVIALVIYRFR